MFSWPLCMMLAISLSAGGGVIAKNYAGAPALASVQNETVDVAAPLAPLAEARDIADPLAESIASIATPEPSIVEVPEAPVDLETRWFNGRAVRPARTISMLVTAYSPDERSCAGSADGITASLHHVETNGFRMVAADSRVLPLGSMITVPGYDNEQVVPVLDRGGAIKGNRLDVLFPTHEEARRWGVRRLQVVVWEYVDGKPENWRALRDGKF